MTIDEARRLRYVLDKIEEHEGYVRSINAHAYNFTDLIIQTSHNRESDFTLSGAKEELLKKCRNAIRDVLVAELAVYTDELATYPSPAMEEEETEQES